MTNILIPVERYCHKKVHVQYETSNINDERCHILKIGQMSRSKGLVPTEISYQKDYTYLCEISKL